MKLLIKNSTSNSIVFQGEVTTKTDYKLIESKYPIGDYSREALDNECIK